eukprot:6894470-Prymnesium_polylepis.1
MRAMIRAMIRATHAEGERRGVARDLRLADSLGGHLGQHPKEAINQRGAGGREVQGARNCRGAGVGSLRRPWEGARAARQHGGP